MKQLVAAAVVVVAFFSFGPWFAGKVGPGLSDLLTDLATQPSACKKPSAETDRARDAQRKAERRAQRSAERRADRSHPQRTARPEARKARATQSPEPRSTCAPSPSPGP